MRRVVSDGDSAGEEAAARAAVGAADKAARDRSMVEHGRRIGGAPGAALAGAMIALRDIYEGPARDEVVAISEHPGEPVDVDHDGVNLAASDIGGDLDVAAPAQPRRAPIVRGRRAPRRRPARYR